MPDVMIFHAGKPVMPTRNKSQGFALITALIFLIIIIIIGITVSRITTSDVRMANNVAFKQRAFSNAESVRDSSLYYLVEGYIRQEGQWSSRFTNNSSNTSPDRNTFASVQKPQGVNNINLNINTTERISTPIDPSNLSQLTPSIEMSLDTDQRDGNEMRGSLAIANLMTRIDRDANIASYTEYDGVDKGAGSAATDIFYVYSRGNFNDIALSEIAVYYLYKPRL